MIAWREDFIHRRLKTCGYSFRRAEIAGLKDADHARGNRELRAIFKTKTSSPHYS